MEKKIVLLHGFGEDSRVFEHIVPALAPYGKVIAPDLPGSGSQHNHPLLPGNDTIEWLADHVYAALQQQGVQHCILLGHSMGGYIALALAEKHPEWIQGLGLLHSTAYPDTEAKKEMRAKAIDFMEQKGGFTFLKTAIPGLFADHFVQKHPEVVQQLVTRAASFETPWLQAYYRAMIARPDRRQVLQSATYPVLIVAGAEDKAVSPEDAAEQAALPATCQFELMQYTGHMGMLENQQAFEAYLIQFISAV